MSLQQEIVDSQPLSENTITTIRSFVSLQITEGITAPGRTTHMQDSRKRQETIQKAPAQQAKTA
jgi:hypothetical protein